MTSNTSSDYNKKVNTLITVFGSKVKNYPEWWINSYYDDYKFYNCSPEKYRKLIKSRG